MSKVSLELEVEKPLVEASKTDPDEFSTLYEHYHPHIRRFFAVKLSSSDVIDDLTARTFEKALKNINKFEYKGYPFSAWLYKIAANLLKDYYRAESKSRFASLEHQVIDVPEIHADSHDSEVILSSQKKFLKKIMKKLDPQKSKIIYLKFYEGYSHAAIAKQLDISVTNVSTIVYRVIKDMRAEFKHEFGS